MSMFIQQILKLAKTRGFYLSLVLLLLAIVFRFNDIRLQGDIDEYVVMAEALSDHGSPVINVDDIKRTQLLVPDMQDMLQVLADGMEGHPIIPKPGFYQSKQGDYFAIHFFTYSALAALPFELFPHLKIAPINSFMFVNLACIFLFAICCRLFFQNNRRAFFATLIFALCGGINYVLWLGPETMSAAFLASAVLLYFSERVFLSCVLIGLAATQNPPIILALGFVPLMKGIYCYRYEHGFWRNLQSQLSARIVLSWLVGAMLFGITLIFGMWAFGVPNIIVKIATVPQMMGWERLQSFFFDLSQGMLIGYLGLWVALMLLLISSIISAKDSLRAVAMIIITILFSISLALPALTTSNWNSGTIGMMRYAFWAGMPFLTLFLIWWRELKAISIKLIVLVFVVQLILTNMALRYSELEFNWLTSAAIKHAPQLYNPEPEIFVERTLHSDGVELFPTAIFTFEFKGKPRKILFHSSNPNADQQICGTNQMLSADNSYANAAYGWRYLNGEPNCVSSRLIDYLQFGTPEKIQFQTGWSSLELGGGEWNGVWSNGEISTISIPLINDAGFSGVKLHGHYYAANRRTHVFANGRDLGWIDISKAPILRIDDHSTKQLVLELHHEFATEAPKTPEFPQGRHLAVFLQAVTVY